MQLGTAVADKGPAPRFAALPAQPHLQEACESSMSCPSRAIFSSTAAPLLHTSLRRSRSTAGAAEGGSAPGCTRQVACAACAGPGAALAGPPEVGHPLLLSIHMQRPLPQLKRACGGWGAGIRGGGDAAGRHRGRGCAKPRRWRDRTVGAQHAQRGVVACVQVCEAGAQDALDLGGVVGAWGGTKERGSEHAWRHGGGPEHSGPRRTAGAAPAGLTLMQQLLNCRDLSAAGAGLGPSAAGWGGRWAGWQAVGRCAMQLSCNCRRGSAKTHPVFTACSRGAPHPHPNTHLYLASIRGSISLSVMIARAASCARTMRGGMGRHSGHGGAAAGGPQRGRATSSRPQQDRRRSPARPRPRTLLSPSCTASTPAASLRAGGMAPVSAAVPAASAALAAPPWHRHGIQGTTPAAAAPPALHHAQVVVLGGRLRLVADRQRVGHHKHGALRQVHIRRAHLQGVGGGGWGGAGRAGQAWIGGRVSGRCSCAERVAVREDAGSLHVPPPPATRPHPPHYPAHRVELHQLGDAGHAHDGDGLVHAACGHGQYLAALGCWCRVRQCVRCRADRRQGQALAAPRAATQQQRRSS